MKINSAVSAVALVLAAASVIPAQDAPAPAGTDDVTNPMRHAIEVEVPESSDPAFERYVNLNLLAAALRTKDAGLLTDCALQFAHAESLLLRSHKDLTAEQLLLAAVQLASNKQDKKSLERLSKVAARLGNKEIEVSLKLSSTSRAARPSLSVHLAATSIEQFAAMKAALADIEAASAANDGAALDGVAQAIAATSLTDSQKGALTAEVDAARKQLADEPDGAGNALSKLTGTSRGGLLGNALRAGLSGGYNFQGDGYNVTTGGRQPRGFQPTYGASTIQYSTSGAAPVTTTAPTAASRPGLPIAPITWYEQTADSSGQVYWIARFFGEDGRTYFMQRYDNVGGQLAPTGQSSEGSYSYDQATSQLRLDGGLDPQYPPYVLKFSLNGSKIDFDSASENHTWLKQAPLPIP